MMVGQKRRDTFYKRMAERKAKRESKLAKKVQEATLERASVLSEDNLDVLRKIVKDKKINKCKVQRWYNEGRYVYCICCCTGF